MPLSCGAAPLRALEEGSRGASRWGNLRTANLAALASIVPSLAVVQSAECHAPKRLRLVFFLGFLFDSRAALALGAATVAAALSVVITPLGAVGDCLLLLDLWRFCCGAELAICTLLPVTPACALGWRPVCEKPCVLGARAAHAEEQHCNAPHMAGTLPARPVTTARNARHLPRDPYAVPTAEYPVRPKTFFLLRLRPRQGGGPHLRQRCARRRTSPPRAPRAFTCVA
eukprot:5797424-Prymnesium_polylepis.1